VNKKIERPKETGEPSATPPPASTEQETTPAPKPAEKPKETSAAEDKPSSTGGGAVSSVAKGADRLPPTMRPPVAGSGGNPSFASSIKALNLEPMRSNPAPKKSQVPMPRPLPSAQEQGSGQSNQNSQQPSDNKQAPAQPQEHAAAPAQKMELQQPPQQQQAQQQQQQPQMQQMQPAAPAQQQQPQQPQMQAVMMPQQFQQMQAMGMMGTMLPPGSLPGQQVQQPQVQQQPAQQPAPAAASAGQKPKGMKLKNVAIARTGQPREGEGASAAPSAQDPQATPIPANATADFSNKENNEPSGNGMVGGTHVPSNGILERTLMLRLWRLNKNEVHDAVKGLTTNFRPGDNKGSSTPAGGQGGRPRPGDQRRPHEGPFGEKSRKGTTKDTTPLKPSEGKWTITQAESREDELHRIVRGLLNKICPENLKIIVERLANVELKKANELEYVIGIIFQKALDEPHYCETYADMVFALRNKYPEFPPEAEGERPHTFTRVLLNTCQNEFESLPTTLEPTDEDTQKYAPDELFLEMKKRKGKVLANMKFIGNLFLRQLLAAKVIGQVVHDLIGLRDGLPEEHMIECVCELLQAIGHTLDSSQTGKALMGQFAARLVDLKRTTGQDGKRVFSKRIDCLIQDLLDLREHDWKKKLFKEQAKTKEEIRKDAMKEQRQSQRGGADVVFSTQTVGVRPSYIDEIKVQGKKKAPMPSEGSQKPVFDQGYVKKLFQYYAEDKKGEDLQGGWQRAAPTTKEAKQGLEWLCDIGFNDSEKEEVVADTLVELLQRNCISLETLRECLLEMSRSLEDLKIDVPKADIFIHSLFARLFMLEKSQFKGPILESLPLENNYEFPWTLMVGALRKVSSKGSDAAVKKALELPGVMDMLNKLRKTGDASVVRKALRDEGGIAV